ncbi:MAG: PaeR7I family type II restriction endonuclease [Kosmotogaceae bacterium]|nr:PaeR7I family type II restriction endonuclease [Kosmotogaceae bacterium]
MNIDISAITAKLEDELSQGIKLYWLTRKNQNIKQGSYGQKDSGARSAVTGGAQMDGIVSIFTRILTEVGVPEEEIFVKKKLELPGFYRPTKEWDLLVISKDQLVIALELKSQVGPSFGNNFNNRTEEALGSATDLWAAFEKGAFNKKVTPWLGYLFLLEDCEKSTKPVKTREPHFKVFPEFQNASYAKRYQLLCDKLIRERLYSSACFLMSDKIGGEKGEYSEPDENLCFKNLVRSMIGQTITVGRE